MASSLSSTAPAAVTRPPIWAWLLAFLGFPLGGLIADLVVGPIDSVGAALAGGLIAGAAIGAVQWLALRKVVPWLWIAATSIGMAAGLAVGARLVGYGVGHGDLMLMGALTGAGVGALQAIVFARERIAGAAWWAVASPPVWAIAWLVASYVLASNVEEQFTNFGASGALVFALLTGLLLTWMFRRTDAG